MELVSISTALEMIKTAVPGDILHLGLYRNAVNEEQYSDLATLLGYKDENIKDGPHKVYSTKIIDNALPGTAWISGISYRPDREPGLYDDVADSVPVIDNKRFYSFNYENLHQIAEAITNETNVYAIYSEAEDKIILTAKIPGIAGNISIQPPINTSYWDSPPETFISGSELDFEETEQVAVQVWIKNTSLPAPEEEEYDIKINVDIIEPETVVDLSSRWVWDEYSENNKNLSVINWGDDSKLDYISDITAIRHTYIEQGSYSIKINGLHLCDNNDVNIKLPISEIEFKTPQIIFTKDSIIQNIENVIGDIFISTNI